MTRLLDFLPPRLLLSGLVGAVLLAAYLVGVEGPRAVALPGLGLILVVVLAAHSRVIAAAGWIAAAIAAVIYVGLALLSTPFTDIRVGAAIAAVLGFGLTGFAAELFARRLYELVFDLSRADQMIEELTIRDPLTGTIKPQFAKQMIAEEIARAQRYQRPISILMVGLDETQDQPLDIDYDDVFARVGRALTDRLRDTDKVSFMLNPPRFLCLLAETPLEGAKIVADRLIDEIRAASGVKFYSGISTYPDDSVHAEGLLEEAESALEVASLTDEPTAHREMLGTQLFR